LELKKVFKRFGIEYFPGNREAGSKKLKEDLSFEINQDDLTYK